VVKRQATIPKGMHPLKLVELELADPNANIAGFDDHGTSVNYCYRGAYE